jgi:hypothetical protein
MDRRVIVKFRFRDFYCELSCAAQISKLLIFVLFIDDSTLSAKIFMRSSFLNCATAHGEMRLFAPILVQRGWGRGTVPSLNQTARIHMDSGRLFLLILSVSQKGLILCKGFPQI